MNKIIDLNDFQKEHLKNARMHLLGVQSTFPAYRKEYKDIDNIILDIETMLGIIQ